MGITLTDFLREALSFGQATSNPGRMVKVMELAWQVQRERNRLASLSRDELAEMGIHPGDAEREAARSLFDLPKSRLERL